MIEIEHEYHIGVRDDPDGEFYKDWNDIFNEDEKDVAIRRYQLLVTRYGVENVKIYYVKLFNEEFIPDD